SRGMILNTNRNTKRTTRYIFVSETKRKTYEKEKKYPVKMEHKQIIPTKPIQDDKLKKEIENYKIFVQYGNYKDIIDYKECD
ncbi:Csa1 family protein, partial [Staphylococcus aureus]|nr:Csa1 family protein [Staphylococcus aureus]